MKTLLFLHFLFVCVNLNAQPGESVFEIDKLDVVFSHPDMEQVRQQKNVKYLQTFNGALHADIYLPPGLKPDEKRPAIIFLNGVGDRSLKNNEIYVSWAKLVAAHGMVAVTMESDDRADTCFNALFAFIKNEQSSLHIDTGRIGIYATSANARIASPWLMGPEAFDGIKAAALYYSEVPRAPYRSDLPVLFIVAEADLHNSGYSHLWTEVVKHKAPWTITLGTGMPHAFDALTDSDDARRLIRQTLDFWQNHLEPVPPVSERHALARKVATARYSGDNKKVIQLIESWFAANPQSLDASGLRLLASSQMREGMYAEAEESYKISISIDPQSRGSLLDMVLISHALNKPDEADKYLAMYEAGQQPEGFTYGYIGRFLLQSGKCAQAKTYFSRAVELGPHPSDHYNLARCQAIDGETDAAFENLFEAVKLGFTYKKAFDVSELSDLRTDRRWQELMQRLE